MDSNFGTNTSMDIQIRRKLEKFFMQFKRQLYKKGEILVHADDAPPGIFYLKEGIVKQYTISKKGDELVLNIFKPISFFPMSWAINNTPNEYFYEALVDVEVYRAPREKTITFIKQESSVLYDLMSRVYSGTDGMMKRMAYLMSGNAYARLITELLIHVRRFGNTIEHKKLIELRISENDLAAQSGMSRETVSRELKILKDKGLVTFNKQILTIKDLDELEEEL